MIIYNKEWLHNKQVAEQVQTDMREGSITPEEFAKIRAAYAFYFYLPRLVIRVGLFILTLIILLFSGGLLSLFAAEARIIDTPAYPMVLGVICYVVLEHLVKNNRYLHSGPDNALLYVSATLFGGGFIWTISKMNLTFAEASICAAFICMMCVYLTVRFADVITALAACISFFAFVYFTYGKVGSVGLATMPFMIMVAAGGLFYLMNRLGKDIRNINYENCIDFAKIISLITLYAAGNYFVVNRLNNMLNNLDDSHTTIPLGFIFWIWTMLVPVLYVLIGIRKKSSMFLRLGLLAAVAAVATFRNYYHLMPIEVALTLAGAILLAASYTVIQYLKKRPNGITYAEPEVHSNFDKLNIEGLIVGQATSHLPNAQNHPTERFGGGSGGGGGSSGDF
ncbi:hypothetical protein ACFQZI_10015 [Mucilaginibacter lutimaris]|uniref:Membrane protein DUF2157 n=1 Tax=Mucilaginibacter lutimaris TaxID=931629 RepID=A0ABW2ZG37_9SPHI